MRADRLRWAAIIALTLICTGALLGPLSVDNAEGSGTVDARRKPSSDDISRFGGDPQAESGDEAEDSGQCLADSDAIQDIRQQREKLAQMKRELDAREAELREREQAVADEMKKLDEVRAEIAKTEDLKKQENQERVSKLVETVESMSPKAAAQLLASIDEALAVTAMQGVSTAKLAKIMNVMDPQRSSRLTEVLAGVVRARALSPATRLSARNDTGQGTANPDQLGSAQQGNFMTKGGESNGQRSNSGVVGPTSPATPRINNDGQPQNQGQRQPAGGPAGR